MTQQKNEILFNRIELIRKKLQGHKIDGLFFFNLSNIFYFSGFTGSDGVLFITPNQTILLIDGRYTTQASLETKNIKIVEYKEKISGIINTINDNRLKNIGLEANYLTLETYNKILSALKGKSLVPLADELKLIRAHKDKTEIAFMKKAADISSAAVSSTLSEIREGVTEKDLSLQLEFNARKLGAEQLAFPTIVASGQNSALPHAQPTDKKIKKGDFIVIDFGVKYKGYCSDETCTFAFGELTDKQKNAYQIVKKAHDKAIAIVKSNIKASSVDDCVRNVFGEKYCTYFVHSTGHGVGLDVHEAPRLASNSKDILEKKMVVTVEPGLYFPGQWGIRIEDMILIKENGCEKITKMNKELTIIE